MQINEGVARVLARVIERGVVVHDDDVIVDEYTADLLVEDHVIVERLVVGALSGGHLAQCRNYLRAAGKKQCLLINFGWPKGEIRRIIPSFACPVAPA